MPPPGLSATFQPGGSTISTSAGSQVELAIRAANRALVESGVPISPRKVNRIVRSFADRARRNGTTFHQFLSDAANLSPQERRRIVGNPDFARAIAYLDPTGETAVNNVFRGFGGVA